MSLNAETQRRLRRPSVIPGYANDYDGHKMKKLVEKDLRKRIVIDTVTGESPEATDDGENHYYLEQKGMTSAIRLNSYRTQKKTKIKRVGLN